MEVLAMEVPATAVVTTVDPVTTEATETVGKEDTVGTDTTEV